jgi:hypothetical protein
LSRLRSRLLKPLRTHRTALGSRGDGCPKHAADHIDSFATSVIFNKESSFNISSNYLIRPRATTLSHAFRSDRLLPYSKRAKMVGWTKLYRIQPTRTKTDFLKDHKRRRPRNRVLFFSVRWWRLCPRHVSSLWEHPALQSAQAR